jgi:CoA:oxalate CoA-transferase
MTYALEGIRVIDMAQHLAGPGTAMYLADQGADVIKVEPRLTGDASRRNDASSFLKQNSRTFLVLNRSKRGITLDIQKPLGREVLFRLLERCDVLIHNLRPRVVNKFDLGFQALHERFPRLIYGSISAFGAKGPYADKGAYDRITQGFSGAMYRRDAEGYPQTAGVWISDCSVPMLMSYGVMLALWVRERTGLGQQVQTSLLQAAIAMQSTTLVRVQQDSTLPAEPGGPGYGIYRCSDGVYINVGALQQNQFQRLCFALDLGHLSQDPRFNDPSRQNEFRSEAYPVINEVMGTKPAAEWIAILEKADIPCAPILERAQVFDEPQMLANEMIVPVEHPVVGRVDMFGVPVHLSQTPGAIRRPSPLLGQHTDEVLQEFGYSPQEIATLRADEVI